MMTILATIVTTGLGWLAAKIGIAFTGLCTYFFAEKKSDDALKTNEQNLENAEASGDKDAINQAGLDSLNNSGGN